MSCDKGQVRHSLQDIRSPLAGGYHLIIRLTITEGRAACMRGSCTVGLCASPLRNIYVPFPR